MRANDHSERPSGPFKTRLSATRNTPIVRAWLVCDIVLSSLRGENGVLFGLEAEDGFPSSFIVEGEAMTMLVGEGISLPRHDDKP